jgi:hypothetical protein
VLTLVANKCGGDGIISGNIKCQTLAAQLLCHLEFHRWAAPISGGANLPAMLPPIVFAYHPVEPFSLSAFAKATRTSQAA